MTRLLVVKPIRFITRRHRLAHTSETWSSSIVKVWDRKFKPSLTYTENLLDMARTPLSEDDTEDGAFVRVIDDLIPPKDVFEIYGLEDRYETIFEFETTPHVNIRIPTSKQLDIWVPLHAFAENTPENLELLEESINFVNLTNASYLAHESFKSRRNKAFEVDPKTIKF